MLDQGHEPLLQRHTTLKIEEPDCHIYSNHVYQVREQLEREPYDFPQLELHKAPDLFSYTGEDIEVVGYQHHPGIKAPIAV